MNESIFRDFLQKKKIFVQHKAGVLVVVVSSETEGAELAKEIFYSLIDPKTVLFLSGGKTPKELYATFAKEKKLLPGAVAVVDERFGLPMHKVSNGLMIKETGFLDYLSEKNIPFYSMLEKGKNREKLARDYDETVHYLLMHFQKSFAILGIGEDGHTASIPAGKHQASIINHQKYVISLTDFPAETKQRITLTFSALSQMNTLLVLAFGEKKKKALEKMFADGSEQEIPARFFKREEVALKTLLITDLKV